MSANGRLTDDELSNADGGMQLANVTAQAWENMAAACEAETELPLSIVRPAGAYRSLFVQGDMKQNPGRWNLNPASSVSLAGPGYSSHGFGRAVDISSFTGRRRTWVLANAGRFGFSRTFGEADPNHFGHDGVTTGPASSGATLTPASTTKTPITAPIKELIELSAPVVLHIVEGAGKDAQFLAGPGIFTHYTEGARANIQARVLGQPDGKPYQINGTEAQWILDGFHVPTDQRVFTGGHTWDWLKDIKFLLGAK